MDGAANLLYGPGSAAWSVTVTPTYQKNIFFTRAELSYVGMQDTMARTRKSLPLSTWLR